MNRGYSNTEAHSMQSHGLGHVTLWHFVPDFEARENHPSIRFEDPFQIEVATSTSQLHGIEYH